MFLVTTASLHLLLFKNGVPQESVQGPVLFSLSFLLGTLFTDMFFSFSF